MIEKIQHKDCTMSGDIFWVFFFSALAANTAMATQADGVAPSVNGETQESEHKELAPSSSPETGGGGDLDQGVAAESVNGETQESKGEEVEEVEEVESDEDADAEDGDSEGEEAESDEDADAEDGDSEKKEGAKAKDAEKEGAKAKDAEKEGAKAKDAEKESAKEIDDFDFSNAEFNNPKEETGTGSIF